MRSDQHEQQMLSRLTTALGDRLASVVVYGPAAHDDRYPALRGEHLLIVVRDLSLETLRLLAEPVRWWLKKGEPWPRLFSPELLWASADVYPIEMLAILQHRRIVFGPDPMADVLVDRAHLRVQCERELREKLMRLREGYIECHGHGRGGHGRGGERELHALLGLSYASFVQIFRGCLHLLGAPLADRDHEVVKVLCEWLDLPTDAFAAVDRIARGERVDDAEAAFAAYYRDLTAVAARIDGLVLHPERSAP